MAKRSASQPHLVFVVAEDWYFVSHRLHMAQAAMRRGYRVSVLCRAGTAADAISDAGILLVPFDMQRKSLNPFFLILEIALAVGHFFRLKPDILHLVALRPVLVGGIAARIIGIRRVVAAITGMGFLFTDEHRHPLLGRMIGCMLARMLSGRKVIVQNRADWATMVRFGLSEKALYLVPGAGVDVEHFVPATNVLPRTRQTVVFPARLLADKGVNEFVEAAALLRGMGAQFVLVGAVDAGNPTAIQPEDLERWQRQQIIQYWGHRRDMVSVFQFCDIVVLPSYREGLPKSLLEAMACGKACVTTNVTGCRDTVIDGVTGIIVPARDPVALSKAISTLLEDRALCTQMGRAGRERVIKSFSTTIINDLIFKIYDDVTDVTQ
jgi:glycosyltransferase involved in cell wall biosynthesis